MTLFSWQEETKKYLCRDTTIIGQRVGAAPVAAPSASSSLPYDRDLLLCFPEISKETSG